MLGEEVAVGDEEAESGVVCVRAWGEIQHLMQRLSQLSVPMAQLVTGWRV